MNFFGKSYGRVYDAKDVIEAMVVELLHNKREQKRLAAEVMEVRRCPEVVACEIAEHAYPVQAIRTTLQAVFKLDICEGQFVDGVQWYYLFDATRDSYSRDFTLGRYSTEDDTRYSLKFCDE